MNNRADANDPNQAQFKAFLNRLADAEVTRADYDWVRRLCSRHSMTAQEWDRRGFNDPNITHLYPTNNEVNLHNTQALNSLDKPILRIEAKNSNAMMRKLRPDRCGGLTNVLFLSNDSRVTLTYNLCPEIGLANGSTGKVIDVKYREGESPQNKDLPYCVWVEMDGYTGPSFFPEVLRRNKCRVFQTEKYRRLDATDKSNDSITTVMGMDDSQGKAQGLTIENPYVLSLGNKEMDHGLSYVAFSRSKVVTNIGIDGGITEERITTQLSSMRKVIERKREDERLRLLGEATYQQLRELGL